MPDVNAPFLLLLAAFVLSAVATVSAADWFVQDANPIACIAAALACWFAGHLVD